jgi:hypothetical protein
MADQGLRHRGDSDQPFDVLAFMLITIFLDGVSAFRQATISFPLTVDAAIVDQEGNRNPEEMAKVTTIGYKRSFWRTI